MDQVPSKSGARQMWKRRGKGSGIVAGPNAVVIIATEKRCPKTALQFGDDAIRCVRSLALRQLGARAGDLTRLPSGEQAGVIKAVIGAELSLYCGMDGVAQSDLHRVHGGIQRFAQCQIPNVIAK